MLEYACSLCLACSISLGLQSRHHVRLGVHPPSLYHVTYCGFVSVLDGSATRVAPRSSLYTVEGRRWVWAAHSSSPSSVSRLFWRFSSVSSIHVSTRSSWPVTRPSNRRIGYHNRIFQRRNRTSSSITTNHLPTPRIEFRRSECPPILGEVRYDRTPEVLVMLERELIIVGVGENGYR